MELVVAFHRRNLGNDSDDQCPLLKQLCKMRTIGWLFFRSRNSQIPKFCNPIGSARCCCGVVVYFRLEYHFYLLMEMARRRLASASSACRAYINSWPFQPQIAFSLFAIFSLKIFATWARDSFHPDRCAEIRCLYAYGWKDFDYLALSITFPFLSLSRN